MIHEELFNLLTHYWGISALAIEPLYEGDSCNHYLVHVTNGTTVLTCYQTTVIPLEITLYSSLLQGSSPVPHYFPTLLGQWYARDSKFLYSLRRWYPPIEQLWMEENLTSVVSTLKKVEDTRPSARLKTWEVTTLLPLITWLKKDCSTSYFPSEAYQTLLELCRDTGALYSCTPQVLLHGDVHPHNWMDAKEAFVLIDWEHACLGPSLWDSAFLAAMNVVEYPEGLWFSSFLCTLREQFEGPLSVDLFVPYMILSRLLWLIRWEELGETQLLQDEVERVGYLLSQADRLQKEACQTLAQSLAIAPGWIITDRAKHADMSRLFEVQQYRSMVAFSQSIESLASEIPQLVILYGEAGRWLMALHLISLSMYHQLANTCESISNGSLLCAREKSEEGFIFLRASILQLRQEMWVDEIVICRAEMYLLRNFSVFLGERFDNRLQSVISEAENLALSFPDDCAMQEELARVYSNGISSLIKNATKEYLFFLYYRLVKIESLWGSQSSKIASAHKVALQNLSRAKLL